jgi:PIN domain nuclease of toxin-antitoxin system
MRLLLDTHVWIWSFQDQNKLSEKVRRAILDTKNELWLSPISVWEFLLLIERKRLKVRAKLSNANGINQAIDSAGLKDAPVTRQVSFMARELVMEHQDPADRFLAATAAVYDLTLVTADEKLLRGRGFRTLANA